MSKLSSIFQPFSLGELDIPNRIVMAPMTRGFSPNGVPSDGVADYYRRRAEHNVGLIVTEGVGIDHPAAIGDSGLGDSNQPVLHGEGALNAWRNIVEEVHAVGGLIAPQLWHQGPLRVNGTGLYPEAISCRPSGIWGPTNGSTPFGAGLMEQVSAPTRPMSEEDIADTISAFERSAANAKHIGFDAIAIHGAHSYLIDAFIWEGTNKRSDRWGGSLQNRLRYGVEVIKAIRAVSGNLPIIYRFSQWKQSDFDAKIAASPAELEEILGTFADAGIDMFDASTRRYETPAFPDFDTSLSLAGWAKKLSGKPSIAVGGIGLNKDIYTSFATGDSATSDNINDVNERISKGEFDFACLGRALIADPEWVTKVGRNVPCQSFSMEQLGSLY